VQAAVSLLFSERRRSELLASASIEKRLPNLLLDLGLSTEMTAALFQMAYAGRTRFVRVPGE
jgi:hypothetical protein